MAGTMKKPPCKQDDEESIIASLEETFAAHIKSPSEAARIREAIAAHVSFFIVNDEADGKAGGQGVRTPGKEITGLRRKYLDALKSNIEARARYDSLCQRANMTTSDETLITEGKGAAGAVLRYFEVSQLRRQHQELEIRRRFADTLNEKNLAVCNTELPPATQDRTNDSSLENDFIGEEIALASATTKVLTAKLQKALLQATHQLEREKTLLADHKARHTALAVTPSPAARLQAIAATRDVLVQELDARLGQGSGEETVVQDELQFEGKDVAVHAAERQERIEELYGRYLQARERLLVAAGRVMAPLPTTSAAKEDIEITRSTQKSKEQRSDLPAITQRLIPLLQLQASSAAMRAFASGLLLKERTETLDVLGKLGEESHLLPSHPMVDDVTLDGEDEIAQRVKAWEFAAQEAENATRGIVGRQVEEGMKGVEDGEGSLMDLKKYLGEMLDGSSDGKKKGGQGTGWRGLNGQLGVDADP